VSFPALPALGRIGRYQIYEELAEGGMARVFLAKREGSNRLCVLKQLHGDLEDHSTASIRFQREAHFVSQLDHPNIARVIDAGLEDGKFCIAMELIEGCTIQQILDVMDRKHLLFPPPVTLTIALEVLTGLAYAHGLRGPDGRALEIVHRDLSPKNVMVTYDGRVKIIDFGVAQGRIDSFRTAPGMIVGTLHYMSPEQALTEKTDHRSDLYTLSVMLWELLAGQPAVIDGKAVEVLEQVIEVTPKPLHVVAPSVPKPISDVVMKGLAKEVDDRWQSAAAYREALSAAMRPLGGATLREMGVFVREAFPPERQAYARWTRAVVYVDGLADAPTIADGSLSAADLFAAAVTPAPVVSRSTQPDKTPPLEVLPSGSEITRPDLPYKNVRSLDKMHELGTRIRLLEATVRRQRRVLILMSLLLIALVAMIATSIDLPSLFGSSPAALSPAD
jgi:serine/threonine-protein kinase